MAPDQEKKQGNPIPTEGIPTIYCNIASLSAGFHEVRIYFAESSPKEVATEPIIPRIITEAMITPRVCVVLTPEFARNVRDALTEAITKYETQFGQLRPNPPRPVQEPATAAPVKPKQ